MKENVKDSGMTISELLKLYADRVHFQREDVVYMEELLLAARNEVRAHCHCMECCEILGCHPEEIERLARDAAEADEMDRKAGRP